MTRRSENEDEILHGEGISIYRKAVRLKKVDIEEKEELLRKALKIFKKALGMLEPSQEEATILKVPCVTLRGETERPITVEVGANVIVSQDREKILSAVDEILSRSPDAPMPRSPELWDGKAAERIVEKLGLSE